MMAHSKAVNVFLHPNLLLFTVFSELVMILTHHPGLSMEKFLQFFVNGGSVLQEMEGSIQVTFMHIYECN